MKEMTGMTGGHHRQQKRLRTFGFVLLLFSVFLTTFAYINDNQSLNFIQDSEGYYMMAALFMCMGIICFMPIRERLR